MASKAPSYSAGIGTVFATMFQSMQPNAVAGAVYDADNRLCAWNTKAGSRTSPAVTWNDNHRNRTMLPILYRDARLVILDKPAGLPVHAGPRGGTSVEDHFPSLSRRRDGPWLVHRLDADTGGCLAIALRKAALIAAQRCFAEGRAEKTYWAIVRGAPKARSGVVETRLRKRSSPSGWSMVAGPGGDEAVSDWRILSSGDGLSWLEVRPRTGRTHQVRAHCAVLGCPILHDAVYGTGGGMLALLARRLVLPLDPPVAACAPLPAHMEAVLRSSPALAAGFGQVSSPIQA